MNTRIELLKRYLQEDPSDSFLRYALALEFIALNEHELAYEHLTSLLNDDPDYLAGYYMAGKTAEALQKNSEAINYYATGIEVAKLQKNQHTLNELVSAQEGLGT
jgi:tetratricopeptide (TPR) repeat protein